MREFVMQGDAPHLKSGHLTQGLFRVCGYGPGTLEPRTCNFLCLAKWLSREPQAVNWVSSQLRKLSCQTLVHYSVGDLHMCAPDSFRSARCLLRGCPVERHANDQPQFPDRNSSLIGTPDIMCLLGLSFYCNMVSRVSPATVPACSFRKSALWMDMLQLVLKCLELCILICGILGKVVRTPHSSPPKPSTSLMHVRALTSGVAYMVFQLSPRSPFSSFFAAAVGNA